MKSSSSTILSSLALSLFQLTGTTEAAYISQNVAPTVKIANGTVNGVHSPSYGQDFFLGIPYAQPPVGNLRFRPPQYINTTRKNIEATSYGSYCYGFGDDSLGNLSEDCLTLNIVRPAGIKDSSNLPVATWIHGGGFVGGSGNSQQFNLSFLVDQSVRMGSPIVGVTLNYRLSAWGFLGGREAAGTQNLNVGLKDQRLALHWIKDNIKAFGGDPSKITIFGESAGAASVGFHYTAFGGRDDGLFRGAIMQSGGSVFYGANLWPTTAQSNYDFMVKETNCTDAVETLQCLRQVPIKQLTAAIDKSDPARLNAWQPVIDGDFVRGFGSEALKNKAYVKVPLVIGTTSDEGSGFGDLGLNTTQQIFEYLASTTKFSNHTIGKLLEAYDESVSLPPRENFTGIADAPASRGSQYHRTVAIMSDYMFIAPRRFITETLKSQGMPVWSYRFRAVTNGLPVWQGAGHFTEVSFVFDNKEGVGYKLNQFTPANPMLGPRKAEFSKLADLMSKNWIRFFAHGDPAKNAAKDELKWIQYKDGNGRSQVVFDLEIDGGSYLETDDYRQKGMDVMNKYIAQSGR
ncbi:Acetylcholinesterase [Dactylellina cionopaga]|nr:Acetylcholinesterase [Dactylellina cionopaga]